jgi:DNA polymerase III subunit alpha
MIKINKDDSLNAKYLKWKVNRGILQKNIPQNDEYLDRINYELGVIVDMGFVDYFLIIQDICEFCDREDIPRGAGRGSAAGSAVSYCLDMTKIDPLKHKLIFERFLNPERKGNPDVDCDIGSFRRSEVFEYLKNQYGRDKVANVIAFSTMGPKAAIRDVARALSIPNYHEVGDKISKAFAFHHKKIEQGVEDVEFIKKQSDKYPELFKFASKICGHKRQVSIHPAAVIVSPEPLVTQVPLYYGSQNKKEDGLVTQWDMYDMEDAGYVKLDLLGLKTLDVLKSTVDLLDSKIDLDKIPENDKDALGFLNNGWTTGMFQLERKYVQDFCQNMGIETFNDIVAMTALIRPGTMDCGAAQEYILRRKGESEVVYPHPCLKEILKDSYGVILFQESGMFVCQEFAGFTMGQADDFRKAAGKKSAEKMAEVKTLFFEKAIAEKGRTKEECEHVFAQLETSQNYSFNLSHAVSYSDLTYKTAYLKAHHTQEFMCSLLNGEYYGSGEKKTDKYIEECRFLGIEIIKPSIKTSGPFCEIRGDRVEFGLVFLKYIGEPAAQAVRKIQGQWDTLPEFFVKASENGVNKRAMTSLIYSGCLDELNRNRKEVEDQFLAARKMITKIKLQRKKKAAGKNLRVVNTFEDIQELMTPVKSHPMSLEQKLSMEFEVSGTYLSGSATTPFEREIRTQTNSDIHDVLDGCAPKDKKISMGGVISAIKTHIVKSGKQEGQEMAFVTLSKDHRHVDCVFFTEAWEKYKGMIEERKVVIVAGRIGKGSLLVDVVKMLSTSQ